MQIKWYPPVRIDKVRKSKSNMTLETSYVKVAEGQCQD